MATIYQCDRCNKMESKELVKIRIPRLPSNSYDDVDSDDVISKDLCNDCHKELFKFMQAIKK